MKKQLADRHIFGNELCEIGKNNPNFVVCNADTKACNLEHFAELFPERAFSIGIAEQDMTDIAAGLAACGNKVFISTFAVFATMRACEQVRTFICHPKLNVTILGTHTGLQVGGDGATHAADEDVGILSTFPNMTIIQPADGVSAKAMAHAAVEFTGPLYVRLHRNPVPDFYDPDTYHFEFGKAIPVADYGKDLTIISSGILLSKAAEAAKILKSRGIGVRLLDMETLKPLDRNAVIRAARETGAILTVEDHSIFNGLGAACAEVIVESVPVPMQRIGIPDCFGESGDPELLYKKHGMDIDSIVQKAIALVNRKKMIVS
jgi:transketolase